MLLDWLRGVLRPRDAPLGAVQWAVLDCETSGLDMNAARLLSIGAVTIAEGRIGIGGAFEAVLRQSVESGADNIVVHGIGGEAQRAGMPGAQALAAFERYAGQAILVAFHAPFDRVVLERAMRESRGAAWRGTWLDLAQLLPALYPPRARTCKSLDDWLGALGVRVELRHDALADAFATGQLLQVALAEAGRQGIVTLRGLLRLAADVRWAG